MPYVRKEARSLLDDSMAPHDPGSLNYVVTNILDGYITRKGLSYGVINEAIGVLECAKLELYRRIAIPYENKKIKENGDVYSKELL